MKVSGIPVAERIIESLKEKIRAYSLTPSLAIVYASNNANSKVYIQHKMQRSQEVGIKTNLFTFTETDQQECLQAIQKLNSDEETDGIIVQLPLFPTWNREIYINAIDNKKDVDGFKVNSPFFGATALAVWEMLEEFAKIRNLQSAEALLRNKLIVILGKGITAGAPSIHLLQSKGFEPVVIDSKTQNSEELIKKADIIISATGKKHIIHKDSIKDGANVIGVGVGKEFINGEEKTFGDIHPNLKEKDILYCPTIGGIGPLTVACLLRNVVDAALQS